MSSGIGGGPIGVLALQGAFARHIEAFERCGFESREVRQPAHLEGIGGLVIPGGESTTMSKLMATFELVDPIAKLLADGLPTFGTCAGMIVLAGRVLDGSVSASSVLDHSALDGAVLDGRVLDGAVSDGVEQHCFGAIDIDVRRNGYGRQIDSFESDVDVSGVAGGPMRAVFIRAPVVERVGENVDVLATVDGAPVVCRQGSVLVSSFHPELTDDDRLHQLFLSDFVAR
ncbi:MAG: pyridoxal 5'-phosphate synthase glutaminase subunit PdxT [Acidimicrobiales bacterium]